MMFKQQFENFESLLSATLNYTRARILPIVSPLVKSRCIVKWSAALAENIHYPPANTLSDKKLIYFRFRFLHRVLAINKMFFTMNKTESPNCEFCKAEIETIDIYPEEAVRTRFLCF